MSSHREAPEISKDPVADNADVYAFVSADKPDTVTIISNFVPLQAPPGGPNFFEFGDDVLYSIYIDNDGDAKPEIEYQFRFHDGRCATRTRSSTTRARSRRSTARTGTSASSTRSRASMGPARRRSRRCSATNLASPPCNIGPRSTPNYDALAAAAMHTAPAAARRCSAASGTTASSSTSAAIFDLGDLRPFQNLHLIPTAAAPGVDDTKTLNIHTIAIQIPIKSLTEDGSVAEGRRRAPTSVLGVWSAASRRKVRMADAANDEKAESGPWVQVSRLGNPLFNEVIVPLGQEGRAGTGGSPSGDSAYVPNVEHPELAGLLPVLYPEGVPEPRRAEGGTRRPRRDPADRAAQRRRPRVPELHRQDAGRHAAAERRGAARGRRPTRSALSAATWPASRTAGASSTTSSPSSCGRSPASPTRWSTRRYTAGRRGSVRSTRASAPAPDRYQSTFPYLGTPHDGFDTPSS